MLQKGEPDRVGDERDLGVFEREGKGHAGNSGWDCRDQPDLYGQAA